MTKRTLLFGSLVAASALLAGCSGGVSPTTRSYQITVTDLTNAAPNSGQPFSPPVFATHSAGAKLWSAGGVASEGIQHIAEEGDRSFLVAALKPLLGGDVLATATPLSAPLPPGQSVTVTITADANHPFLSSAWMLGRTNDGFAGQDSVDIYALREAKTYELYGLDAGTEKNNEQRGLLGALGGGNARDPENGTIQLHNGILGTADAPLSWNWSSGSVPARSNPVARVTITPITTP